MRDNLALDTEMLIREAKSNNPRQVGKSEPILQTKSQIMHFCPSQLGLGAPPASRQPRLTALAAPKGGWHGRPRIALKRMYLYQWPLELSKLIKSSPGSRTENRQPPLKRPVSSKPQPATLPARICRRTAALRCAMPPRQCRVIAVARCHDLPRDLTLVRKRHRTVGKSENVPASTNQDLGLVP